MFYEHPNRNFRNFLVNRKRNWSRGCFLIHLTQTLNKREVTITTIHPVFFESDVSLTVVFMVGLSKEGHSRDSKTEKSSVPGYLKKGFLLILHKQNSTHLHNPCNTPSQSKYFEMKTFFQNLCLTNDSFLDTDWRSFEET